MLLLGLLRGEVQVGRPRPIGSDAQLDVCLLVPRGDNPTGSLYLRELDARLDQAGGVGVLLGDEGVLQDVRERDPVLGVVPGRRRREGANRERGKGGRKRGGGRTLVAVYEYVYSSLLLFSLLSSFLSSLYFLSNGLLSSFALIRLFSWAQLVLRLYC